MMRFLFRNSGSELRLGFTLNKMTKERESVSCLLCYNKEPSCGLGRGHSRKVLFMKSLRMIYAPGYTIRSLLQKKVQNKFVKDLKERERKQYHTDDDKGPDKSLSLGTRKVPWT